MSRVSASVSAHGSIVAAAPANGGFWPGFVTCPLGPDAVDLGVVHPERRVGRRSRDASHGAVDPDVPRVVHALQRRRERVEGAFPIAAATAAVFGSTAKAPMFRVTVCGPPIRFTVGVNPRSHAGNACSSLDFQYGMHTVGSAAMSSSSIRSR
jgi:hypothetical protein